MTTSTPATPNWSPQQIEALNTVSQWLQKGYDLTKPFFYLAGYAGTGKTTLARHLAAGLNGLTVYAAYTGKAALQLRKSGCANASTIHSLTYKFILPDKEKIRELEERLAQIDERDARRRAPILRELAELAEPKFVLNTESPLADSATSLLVLDECSMVDEEIARDLLSFRKPILVLGDPGQLPPINGEGYFTCNTPDAFLTEIHRQAEGNPIIALSKHIREHGTIPAHQRASILFTRDENLLNASQILSGKNDTRRTFNNYIRNLLGRRETYPVSGDKLICTRNNNKLNLFNGLFCTSDSNSPRFADNYAIPMSLTTELGAKHTDLRVSSIPFDEYNDPTIQKRVPYRFRENVEYFDYGYCITVHKSQGSQFDDVLLIDDNFFIWDADARKQWLYTAVTRAIKTVTIVSVTKQHLAGITARYNASASAEDA